MLIYGTSHNDYIGENNGDDIYPAYSTPEDDTIYGFSGDDDLLGYQGNDSIAGGTGNDHIYGQDGNDTLVGGSGNDQIFGGIDDDSLYGSDGNDEIFGNDGNDKLFGGSGDDNLLADEGNDSVYGGAGNDLINGSAGADLIDGGSGSDTVFYDRATTGVRVDLYRGDAEGDQAEGDVYVGIEGIFGSEYKDNLYGDAKGNGIQGNKGNDFIWGRAGQDFLLGEDGNDVIVGGKDWDFLVGGAGADKFRVRAQDEADGDTITDFVSGEDSLSFFAPEFGNFTSVEQGVNFFTDDLSMAPEHDAFFRFDNTTLLFDTDGTAGSADELVLFHFTSYVGLTAEDIELYGQVLSM